jgi:hypothetical protein
MIIPTDAETFDKIEHAFMIKNIQNPRNRRDLPQHNTGKLQFTSYSIRHGR